VVRVVRKVVHRKTLGFIGDLVKILPVPCSKFIKRIIMANTVTSQDIDDLAKGIAIAQLTRKPAIDFREIVDTGVMKSIPHDLRKAAIRRYAEMVGTTSLKEQVFSGPTKFQTAKEVVTKALGGAAAGATLGLGAGLLINPRLLAKVQSLTRHTPPAEVSATYRKLLRPIATSATIGAVLEGGSTVRDIRANAEYSKSLQSALARIRSEENPNPYINALLLTNRKDLQDFNSSIESAREGYGQHKNTLLEATLRGAATGEGLIATLPALYAKKYMGNINLDNINGDSE
jgi:hypothetical protein